MTQLPTTRMATDYMYHHRQLMQTIYFSLHLLLHLCRHGYVDDQICDWMNNEGEFTGIPSCRRRLYRLSHRLCFFVLIYTFKMVTCTKWCLVQNVLLQCMVGSQDNVPNVQMGTCTKRTNYETVQPKPRLAYVHHYCSKSSTLVHIVQK